MSFLAVAGLYDRPSSSTRKRWMSKQPIVDPVTISVVVRTILSFVIGDYFRHECMAFFSVRPVQEKDRSRARDVPALVIVGFGPVGRIGCIVETLGTTNKNIQILSTASESVFVMTSLSA
jgi:hypothetical protein